MRRIEVRTEDELSKTVLIRLNTDQTIAMSLEERDSTELVLVLKGYFKLITGESLPVDKEEAVPIEDLPPPYVSQHKVIPEKWSYVNQQQMKTMCFTSLPLYQNVNKKTNGLYNTIGRQSKPPLVMGFSLDSNMNTSISNRNHQFKTEYTFDAAAFKAATLNGGCFNNSGFNGSSTFNRADINNITDSNSSDFNAAVFNTNNFNATNYNPVDIKGADYNNANAKTSNFNRASLNSLAFDLHRVTSKEILHGGIFEAKNDEALRRVKEMQQMVENSEKYLIEQQHMTKLREETEWQETTVDIESDNESLLSEDISAKLQHSDSLILLGKGNKDKPSLNAAVEMLRSEMNQSESDNDSCTPTNSPKKRLNPNKNSRISFGLHSPDTAVNENQDLKSYLKQLKEQGNCEATDSDIDTITDLYVFDPDIIDLTLIPPPATPDELDCALPVPIDVPPISFADSMDKLNKLGVLHENMDLEEFLASVTVPPPTQKATPAVELTPEEIMSYIIPPPPGSSESLERLSIESLEGNEESLNEIGRRNSNISVKSNIIEYATVERKGAFLCCAKSRGSRSTGNSRENINEVRKGDVQKNFGKNTRQNDKCENAEQNDKPENMEQNNKDGSSERSFEQNRISTTNGMEFQSVEEVQLQPPPRRSSEEKPPERPPKNISQERQRSHSLTMTKNGFEPPPKLPPRGETYQAPPHLFLPPKKPPLPPVPPIEVLRSRKMMSPQPKSNGAETRTACIGSPHLQRSKKFYNDLDMSFGAGDDVSGGKLKIGTAVSTPTSPHISK